MCQHRLQRWAENQAHHSWWLLPLQPIFTLTALAAGISAVWPGMNFSMFHDHLGHVGAHCWLALGVLAPTMTALAYWMILRPKGGLGRYRGFWVRLGGDVGQFAVIAVFTILHAGDTGSDEDIYVTVGLGGVLAAALVMVIRDVWEITLTEKLANRIHREADE